MRLATSLVRTDALASDGKANRMNAWVATTAVSNADGATLFCCPLLYRKVAGILPILYARLVCWRYP